MGHGAGKLSGRLEVFYNGEWGSVCASGMYPTLDFNLDAAAVACRQMGLGNIVDLYSVNLLPDQRYDTHTYTHTHLAISDCSLNGGTYIDCSSFPGS